MDVNAVTAGHTVLITALTLQLGQASARLLKGKMFVDAGTPNVVEIDFTIDYRDAAFDEFNIYGGPRKLGDRTMLSAF